MMQMTYQPGDHIKVEFEGENGAPGEWLWCIVRDCDDKRHIVYAVLDNEPLNDYAGRLKLGSELAISFDRIKEHRKPSEFTK
jgi:hypothetical protein